MSAAAVGKRRVGAARLVFAGALALIALVAAGLGVWQVQRRSWKLNLIARVEARIHAEPVAAPGAVEWPLLDAADAEYRRIVLQGRYIDSPETLTMAVTERGPGFWVLAPFRSEAGFTVLVNRGFVPEDKRGPEDRRPVAGEQARVVGLLRLTEPGGGFLRANDPAGGRWYSRDVAAIASARRLGVIAPYFVDADAVSEPGPLPQGGMTQISFRNAHLVYALTWFCLALMSAGGAVFVLKGKADDEAPAA